jgi:hypothetical protein
MTTTMATRKVGDKVMIDDPKFPGIWTIKSIGPKNTVVEPDNGGRGLRTPHWMLKDVTDEVTVTAVPLQAYYVPGELVRITMGKYEGLYVVLADKGERVNVAKIGGDGGRYVRAPKGRTLVKVDPADVLK